jgi:ribose 5-phosphate isomerase B
MKLYLASDHAGFSLKGALLERLEQYGYGVEDCGPHTFDPEDDYPDIVAAFVPRVLAEPDALGIICAGSGQGEAMAANRIIGARAAVFYGPRAAVGQLEQGGGVSEDGYDGVRLMRRHNDANILSIGARFVSLDEAAEAVRLFAETPFSGEPRHLRRLAKF